ncbi:TIGR04219 family outer membrane beta-barrel protein [Marinospirillum insulare]|uniref:Membrane protein n=1 Tax=Marinospirillum insulare TaxID=217169 RepID=A0ABQ5ZX61_9GAMM|nr:TIGR04219 family outer membrane beta-barrel protein [Marinospirillum insulare]GLR64765.1 membrane protein [Marinospirillum insulare]
MRKILTLAGVGLLTTAAMQAQALEFNVLAGGNVWNASPSGNIQGKKNQPELDVKDKLGLSSDNQTHFFVQFDHPVPVIPNFRVSRTALEFSGNKNTGFEFLGETFTGNTQTDIDLSHTDFTAYYRLLDGVTSFIPLVDLRAELGLTVRNFDGGFEVKGSTSGGSSTQTVDLSAPLPMGYAGLRVGLPFGLSVGGKVDAIGYSGSSLSDITLDARYQYEGLPLIKPGVTAGYRSFNAKLDDLDDTYGDLEFSGAFFGAYIRAGF